MWKIIIFFIFLKIDEDVEKRGKRVKNKYINILFESVNL